MLKPVRGVTLIELIAGIVVLAISLSLITSVLGPLSIKSADPWHQVRAAELGHSLMNEIMGKSFDEYSNRSGSLLRCNESGATACTAAADFGPDCLNGGSTCPGGPFEQRSQFDDVDDFHAMNLSGNQISNIFGNDPRMVDIYRSYQLQISVSYDNALTKRILISVTTPTGDLIEFSALKGNW